MIVSFSSNPTPCLHLTSLAAISATCRPWKRAAANSFSLGILAVDAGDGGSSIRASSGYFVVA
jgi:hypothetical protein